MTKEQYHTEKIRIQTDLNLTNSQREFELFKLWFDYVTDTAKSARYSLT